MLELACVVAWGFRSVLAGFVVWLVVLLLPCELDSLVVLLAWMKAFNLES